MSHQICPWWLGALLTSPVRKLVQDPIEILAPYIRPRMTVLEPGPGMGFFTVELARLVGPQGRVIAVDLQPKMLEGLRRRAVRAKVDSRIILRLAQNEEMLGLNDYATQIDFVLACAVVHELKAPQKFFDELVFLLKPGAQVLLVEPRFHVSTDEFNKILSVSSESGFLIVEEQRTSWSQSVILAR